MRLDIFDKVACAAGILNLGLNMVSSLHQFIRYGTNIF
jgi:hypothetical protein